MFVRKKPNKSGTHTVQVVHKDRVTRKNKVIKTIGTSSDSVELSSMVREAQEYIDEQNGPMLPMDYDDPFETSLETFLEGISNAQLQVIGPELIFGTLYDVIGYDCIANEMFRHLVICRLFNPGSKLKTVEYLWHYMNVVYDVEKIYKFLDNLCYRKDKDCKKDKEGKFRVVYYYTERIGRRSLRNEYPPRTRSSRSCSASGCARWSPCGSARVS